MPNKVRILFGQTLLVDKTAIAIAIEQRCRYNSPAIRLCDC